MPGKLIHLYNAPSNSAIKEIFCFITIQNGHSYTISTAIDKVVDDKIKQDLNDFYKTLQFKGKPYNDFK
jgi:hypothetical protein